MKKSEKARIVGTRPAARLLLLSILCILTGCALNPESFTPAQLAERAIERRAVEAVIWGMPAVNYDLMLQEMLTKTSGKVNQVVYWGRPLDWHNQTLTPNPDTLYVMVLFDTKGGPIVIDLPPADGGGSFNANIVTAWQVPLADAGLLGEDKGKGGKFVIMPPGYQEKVSDEFIPRQSHTFGGFMLFRANLPSHSDADVQKSIAYSKRIKVYPLAQVTKPPATEFTDLKDIGMICRTERPEKSEELCDWLFFNSVSSAFRISSRA